jgi:metacaspase-1
MYNQIKKYTILTPAYKMMFMRSAFFTIAALLITSFLFGQAKKEPNKIALIIAIGDYPESGGWDKLSSGNDVPLIAGALKHQGFKDENITIIKDKQATFQGMKDAIDKFIKKAQKGDIAVLHYSGHGQQIDDDNGDEGDGLDEALVPYDAPEENTGANVNKHFRDDLLGQKLKELRTALGPEGNLLVVLDACHSGTATRGLGKKRGTTKIYRMPENMKKVVLKTNSSENDLGIVEDGPELASMVAFEACAPDQCNTEAKIGDLGVGSLSLSFSKAIEKADKNTTYRGLFENIRLEMAAMVPGQTPMSEGELDKVIFGGKLVSKAYYFTADSITKDDLIKITAGKLFGIFEGTTVKLYKPDTRPSDTANLAPLATGKIIRADQYTSIIKLDKKVPVDIVKSSWIYLDEINYGDLSVKVKINIPDAERSKLVNSYLKDIKQASLVTDNGDLTVVCGENGFSKDSITLVTAQDMVIWSASKDMDQQKMKDTLQDKIADFALARYLKGLNMTNTDYQVTFEILPVKKVNNEWVVDDVKKKLIDKGSITLKDGDRFRIKIINNTNRILFYTILDIAPDNSVTTLFPPKNDRPDNYNIRPDQSPLVLNRIFKVGKPYGTDVVKIIASDKPLDLAAAFSSREGMATRGGGLSPFEKSISSKMKKEPKKRGMGSDDDANMQSNTVNINSTSITITK